MSFPKSITPLKSAICDLKDIVHRQHGEDTETVHLVNEIEEMINNIEVKASALTKRSKRKNSTDSGINIAPGQIQGSVLPAL